MTVYIVRLNAEIIGVYSFLTNARRAMTTYRAAHNYPWERDTENAWHHDNIDRMVRVKLKTTRHEVQ